MELISVFKRKIINIDDKFIIIYSQHKVERRLKQALSTLLKSTVSTVVRGGH